MSTSDRTTADEFVEVTGTDFPFRDEAIISLALDLPQEVEPHMAWLAPDHFRTLPSRYVWGYIANLHEQYGVMPTRAHLRHLIAQQLTIDESYRDVLAIVDRLSDPRETPMVRDELLNYVRRKTLMSIHNEEGVAAAQRGDATLVTDMVEKYWNIGTDADNPFAGLVNVRDLLKKEIEEEWIVEELIAPDIFTVIGGPLKSMKTGIAIDLAISLATGTKFLGHFATSGEQKVVMCTGETTGTQMQKRSSVILRARGKDGDDLEDRLHWAPRTPKLSSKKHLQVFRNFLRRHRPAVTIIDPLYVSMLSEKQNASDLMQTGPVLERIHNLCRDHDVTPIFVHHFNRKGDPHSMPTLTNLAQTGPAEYAGQWLLVNRRQDYTGNGLHHLWLNAGGRHGYSHQSALILDEGSPEKPRWGLMIETAAEHRHHQRDDRNNQLVDKLLSAYSQLCELEAGVAITRNKLRKATGMNLDNINKAINLAKEAGDLEEYNSTVAGNSTTCYRQPQNNGVGQVG